MRFSLKFIFALTTLSSFAAFIYQLEMRKQFLVQDNSRLQSEISTFNRRLEIDLPYLRIGKEADSGVAELSQQMHMSFSKSMTKRRLKPFKKNVVSVRNIPDLKWDVVHFLVNVPENCDAQIVIKVKDFKPKNDLASETTPTSQVDPRDELATIVIPSGVSQMTVETRNPSDDLKMQGFRGPRVLTVVLNSQVVFELKQIRDQYNLVSNPKPMFLEPQMDSSKQSGQMEICELRAALLELQGTDAAKSKRQKKTMTLCLAYKTDRSVEQ